jgi:hypothetical protein
MQQSTQVLVAPVVEVVSDVFFQVAAHDLEFFRRRIFEAVLFAPHGHGAQQKGLGPTGGDRRTRWRPRQRGC